MASSGWQRVSTTVIGVRPWLLAVAVCLVSVAGYADWRRPLVVGVAVAGAAASLVAARHLAPVAVVGVAGVLLLGMWPAAVVAGYYLGASDKPRRLVAAWTSLVSVVVVARALYPDAPAAATGWGNVTASLIVFVVLPVILGSWVRERRHVVEALRERAGRLERERDAAVAEERARERSRIAREMHDVVAHKVSLMVIHAGAIDVATSEAKTRGEAQLIHQLGRQALSNLRDVLSVLRDDTRQQTGTRPLPGTADLDELLENSRQAGLTVVREDRGSAIADVPAAVGAGIFRVVQEALTNVHRHAGDATVHVGFDWWDDAVHVSVTDCPRGRAHPAPPGPGSGLGLVGLSERVSALGGTFEAGPGRGGSFVVRARLPLRAEAAGS